MNTIYEGGKRDSRTHLSLITYRNLNNLSHYHSDHELILVREGEARVTAYDTVFSLHAGDALFVHSNGIHRIETDRTTVTCVLKADRDYFAPVFAGRRLTSPVLKDREGAARLLDDIRTEQRASPSVGGRVSDSLATVFFARMLRGQPTAAVTHPGTQGHRADELYPRISETIAREYPTLTFAAAARELHMSEPYFSKCFHRVFGMTFTQYLNTVKVVAAIEHLREGRLGMTEIAMRCGFPTIRSFNRIFKAFTGYTPTALPKDYVFLYRLHEENGLDPTLSCTEILTE